MGFDLRDTGAMLYQLSYEVCCKQVKCEFNLYPLYEREFHPRVQLASHRDETCRNWLKFRRHKETNAQERFFFAIYFSLYFRNWVPYFIP